MGTVYSAVDYRTNLKNNFNDSTGRHVIVRDSRGATLADGILGGFRLTSALALSLNDGHSNVPGGACYAFTSGGPPNRKALDWDPTHSIEVV